MIDWLCIIVFWMGICIHCNECNGNSQHFTFTEIISSRTKGDCIYMEDEETIRRQWLL